VGLRRFVERYGWRAYALPVLTVLTVAAVIAPGHGGSSLRHPAAARPAAPRSSATQSAAAPPARGTTPLKVDSAGVNAKQRAIKAAELPAGGAYTSKGTGSFRILPGATGVTGHGQLQRYTISVENGISGVDIAAFAAKVDATLADKTSWAARSVVALQRVDTGPADFQISLTSSLTVRTLCGYEIPVETSCWDSTHRRVALNVSRWVRGAASYSGDLDLYRTYAINHEVGHALGHMHAHRCLPGGLAPIMMQQTIGLRSVTGAMCQANALPYPRGVAGAPGPEEPDTPQNSEFGLSGE
jgi:hypothetical protein